MTQNKKLSVQKLSSIYDAKLEIVNSKNMFMTQNEKGQMQMISQISEPVP